jgi:hypothetical protein
MMPKAKNITFAKVPKAPLDKIWAVVKASYPKSRGHFEMDMAATEAVNPMDWQRMADSDEFNICHDVFGILNCLNRETGRLENLFLPRFSKAEPQS